MQTTNEPSSSFPSDIDGARELSLDELDNVSGGEKNEAYEAGLRLARSLRKLCQ